MGQPKVDADFHNPDAKGRLRLNCIGTLEDLSRQQVHLRDGLALPLYTEDVDQQGQPDELRVAGVAQYSADEQCWVAVIDWAAIRHASQERAGGPNGADLSGPAGIGEQQGQTSSRH